MAFLGPFREKPREDGIFWIGFALFPSVNCTCFVYCTCCFVFSWFLFYEMSHEMEVLTVKPWMMTVSFKRSFRYVFLDWKFDSKCSRWWFDSKIFYVHPENWGNDPT